MSQTGFYAFAITPPLFVAAELLGQVAPAGVPHNNLRGGGAEPSWRRRRRGSTSTSAPRPLPGGGAPGPHQRGRRIHSHRIAAVRARPRHANAQDEQQPAGCSCCMVHWGFYALFSTHGNAPMVHWHTGCFYAFAITPPLFLLFFA
jgi:hypothetical protein